MIIKYSVNQKFSCTQFKKSKFVKFFIVKKIMWKNNLYMITGLNNLWGRMI